MENIKFTNLEKITSFYEKMIEEQSGDTFKCGGIYAILINNRIVYIGKSINIHHRIASHLVNIEHKIGTEYKAHKYEVLREAHNRDIPITFKILYTSFKEDRNEIIEDIGDWEGLFIRALKPALNYQIPKKENWHKFTVNKNARTITLEEILNFQGKLK